MKLAYVLIETKKDGLTKFAIIGQTDEKILSNALKYGENPVIISPLYQMNKNWN